MILGFKQQFPWKEPTYFREKILAGVGINESKIIEVTSNLYGKPPVFHDGYKISEGNFKPKLHTFREDPHNRWKAGMSIQMVYRGKNYSIADHFNKGIPELEKCKSVQKIKLWVTGSLGELKDGQREQIIKVHAIIDGKRIENTERLVINDGFDDVLQFANWFKKPWEGKILHWSDLRY